MPKILLTGGSGRLGTELRKLRDYVAPTHEELDITDEPALAYYLARLSPNLIVLSGGYVKSLEPEKDSGEALECFKANVLSAQYFVRYARCPIVYISTEGVIEPYNIYTGSKLMAEGIIKQYPRHLILRTNFWPRPFPFPKVANDLWTIGDYIDVIAKKIDGLIESYLESQINRSYSIDGIVNVGTGAKLLIDLAKQTSPDIEGVPAATFGIPQRKGLLKI